MRQVAIVALSIVRAAFASAWRPIMDALDGDEEARKKMFQLERDLAEMENLLRRK